MNEYWFRPKTYGYGATPITWQGWALTIAAVIVIAVALLIPNYGGRSPSAWLAFFAVEAAVVAALWIVSRRKTEGEWRWRWGGR
jgi:hypothetical protein